MGRGEGLPKRASMGGQGAIPIRGLLIAQFLGAFNDNAWKILVGLLGFQAVSSGVPDGNRAALSMTQMTLAFVVFTLPLMLFSLPAGVLADRISKRTVIVGMKVVEIALMAAATLVLLFDPGGGVLALVVLGLMGVQSALFSPAKYGILPELLPSEQLAEGNGKLEMWTFFAIIAGTAAGGLLLGLTQGAVWLAGLFLTGLAVAGWQAARRIPDVPAARATGSLRATVEGSWRAARADRSLWLSMLGQAVFWAMASLLGQVLLAYAQTSLDLADSFVALPLVVLVAFMGAGSVLAGKLSQSKLELGLIPLGALALSLSSLLLGLLAPGIAGTLILVVPIGLGGGLLLVPLDALLQSRSPQELRGGVLALTNVLVFGGVLAGSLGAELMSRLGLDTPGILLGASFAMLAGTAWAIRLLPIVFLRMLAVLVAHTVYRQRVLGLLNVPRHGGCLLVANHVSFVDGILLGASLDRVIRFLVDANWFDKPLIGAVLRTIRAIPIVHGEGPKAMLRALKKAGEQLDQGEVVCIFAEGQITRTGMLLPFKRGLERILKGRDVPVIPVYLHGVWGSIFSFEGGRFLRKLPRRVPCPVTVVYGSALPAKTPLWRVRAAVHELGTFAWRTDRSAARPLHAGFIRGARRRPLRLALSDPDGPRLGFLRFAAAAVGLARALREAWRDQEHVGILLPPSVPGALTNVAASLAGKTSVNLNYTTGESGMESAARQAGLRTVVTSRTFLEKANLTLPPDVERIWIEDTFTGIGAGDRWLALLAACFLPSGLLERYCGAGRRVRGSDVCTVIFSSGSTGDPKGVMLTHGNVASNVAATAQVFRLHRDDRMLGILPLFHSFGYALLWIAATRGIAIAFALNPLDAAKIGNIVQGNRCTMLVATPTFLQLYIRRCTPAQFGSLRLVVAGAEKLRAPVAQLFEDTFGIRPLEGYGTTECSPVIAASAPDYRAPGFFQPGARRGSVGQPLPGVAVRAVDPDSFEPREPGEPGLLLVSGPNLMKGYLGRPDLTEQVMHQGWYVTGDIGRLDEDGFLWITDRLSRFSKVGGEMVPHGRVEEALQAASGQEDQAFAVTAVADPKRGERLLVLHTLADDELALTIDRLAQSDLPNLFRPKRDDFIRVKALPVLGSGKLNLVAVRRIAAESLAALSPEVSSAG